MLSRRIAAVGIPLATLLAASGAWAQGAAPPPDPWFPGPGTREPAGGDPAQQPAPPSQPTAPQPDGAYVQQPPSQPPPAPLPPDVPPFEEPPYSSEDTALLMAMIAVRPYATHVAASDAVSTDPDSLVAGHVGIRGHGSGFDDDIVIRADLEAFLGASSEGVEGEGRGFLSLGLAKDVATNHFLMFRFGAGGELFGNDVVDYQVADLPALELGYIHTGADGFIEIAPRVAMGILQMSAFGTGHLEPDPAPAMGGRLLAGGDTLWGTIDYEVVTGDKPLQIGALTACFAEKFSICVDGRVASASLAFGAGAGSERVTAISGGLSLGLGEATVEH